MKEIELVIKIPEKVKQTFDNAKDEDLYGNYYDYNSLIGKAIQNGIPIPKGHGRLKDMDKFLEKVKKDREHEIYLHSWTADMVLERLDSWYAPTIIESDRSEENG